MGIKWSKAATVASRSGKDLYCVSDFPTDNNTKEVIWEIWRSHKNDIKDDNLGVMKEGAKWKIKFRCPANQDTLKKIPNGSGEITRQWIMDRNEAIEKWGSLVTELSKAWRAYNITKKFIIDKWAGVNPELNDLDEDHVDLDDLGDLGDDLGVDEASSTDEAHSGWE